MEYALGILNKDCSREHLFMMKEELIRRTGQERADQAINNAWKTLKMIGI
jgi:hypothetical protein